MYDHFLIKEKNIFNYFMLLYKTKKYSMYIVVYMYIYMYIVYMRS